MNGGFARRQVAAGCFAMAWLASLDASAVTSKDECMRAAEQSQPLRRDGHLKAARKELLVCSQSACPGFVRTDCIRWLSEVDSSLPSVVVQVVDSSGASVPNARLLVDGVPAVLDGAEIPLDPGGHVFRIEHEGSAPAEQTVAIGVGERRRVVSMTLASAAVSPSRRRSGSASLFPPGRTVPIVLFVGVGMSLALASYFWIAGLGDRSSLASSCAPSHSCSSSTVDSAHGKLVVGDILGGVGIVLAGIGTWLYVTQPPTSPGPSASPVPAGAMLHWDGRF